MERASTRGRGCRCCRCGSRWFVRTSGRALVEVDRRRPGIAEMIYKLLAGGDIGDDAVNERLTPARRPAGMLAAVYRGVHEVLEVRGARGY